MELFRRVEGEKAMTITIKIIGPAKPPVLCKDCHFEGVIEVGSDTCNVCFSYKFHLYDNVVCQKPFIKGNATIEVIE